MDRIARLTEFLKEQPEDSFVRHALGLELIKLGKEEDARHLFEKIILSDPGYIGTYYHLAKLFERKGDTDQAVAIYEQGMIEAKKAGDNHAYGELRGALEELTF